MFELNGRVALITGSGQGVGAEIARTLGRQGASIVVNDLVEERAAVVVDEIVTAGGRAITAVGDVTDPESVAAMVEKTTRELGPVDILVNNAGLPVSVTTFKKFIDTERARDWDPFINLNLYGVLYCTQAVLPSMVERQWGRIVTIVSDAGRLGEPGLAVYGAAKAAAAAFSKALAKEVGRHGITSNCVSLGAIFSPHQYPDEESIQKSIRYYPMRRLGQPDDVAAAVTWLASEEGGWVTAQTVPVNGGYASS